MLSVRLKELCFFGTNSFQTTLKQIRKCIYQITEWCLWKIMFMCFKFSSSIVCWFLKNSQKRNFQNDRIGLHHFRFIAYCSILTTTREIAIEESGILFVCCMCMCFFIFVLCSRFARAVHWIYKSVLTILMQWLRRIEDVRVKVCTFEPQREKTNNVDSDQVWHKPGCTATGDG